MREARRVLRKDGTLWLNLGDCFWSRPNGSVGATTLEGSRAAAAEFRRTNALRKNRPADQVLKPQGFDRRAMARGAGSLVGRLVAALRRDLAQAQPDAGERD